MAKKKAGALVPIGKKIKQERLKKKMTLGQVSKETGLSTDTLKKIEAEDGARRPHRFSEPATGVQSIQSA